MLLTLLVEVGQVFSAELGVTPQVKVGAVGDALQLPPTPGKPVLYIIGILGVMGQLVRVMAAQSQVLAADAVAHVPVEPGLHPLLEPFIVGARLDEELHLHLLELASAEGEVAWGYLVAEGLADLTDAKGQLVAGGVQHVAEVDEYALGRLRAQVYLMASILHRAHKGAEH